MTKKVYLLIFFIFFVNLSWARLPGMFIDIGYGARSTGMAGTGVSIADDIYAMIWNPAGLANIDKKEFGIMYMNAYGLIPYTFVGFITPLKSPILLKLKKRGNITSVSEKKIKEETDKILPEQTNKQGISFNLILVGDEVLREITMATGYGQLIKKYKTLNLLAGTSLKLRTASVGNNLTGGNDRSKGAAMGLGCDLSVLGQYKSCFSFGLLLRDFFSPMLCSNTKDSYFQLVPMTISYGLSGKIKDTLVALQINGLTEICAGCEAKFYEIFFGRLGLKRINQEKNQHTALTLGCGFTYPLPSNKKMILALDLSYEVRPQIADTFRISTNFGF